MEKLPVAYETCRSYGPGFFLIVSVAGLLRSLLLAPLPPRLALVNGLLEQPNSRKVYCRALPRLGGLAVARVAVRLASQDVGLGPANPVMFAMMPALLRARRIV